MKNKSEAKLKQQLNIKTHHRNFSLNHHRRTENDSSRRYSGLLYSEGFQFIESVKGGNICQKGANESQPSTICYSSSRRCSHSRMNPMLHELSGQNIKNNTD